MFGLEVISRQMQPCFLVKGSLGFPAWSASLCCLSLPVPVKGAWCSPWPGKETGMGGRWVALVKLKMMEGFCRALLSVCDFWAASITVWLIFTVWWGLLSEHLHGLWSCSCADLIDFLAVWASDLERLGGPWLLGRGTEWPQSVCTIVMSLACQGQLFLLPLKQLLRPGPLLRDSSAISASLSVLEMPRTGRAGLCISAA